MTSITESNRKRVIFYSKLGNALEYYDFSLYVFLSPILGELFFPTNNFYESVLYGYITFFFSFLARPLGGMLFALIGKKYGVGVVFNSTVALMGIATILLSILPEYQSIGYYAPLFLFILRSVQCFSLAGEFVSTLVVTLELQDKNKRETSIGNIVSAGTVGWLVGSALASVVLYFIKDTPQLKSLIWRIPFFVGGITSIILFILRYKLFSSLKKHFAPVVHNKVKDDVQTLQIFCKKLLTVLLAGWNGVLFYGLFIYPPVNSALEYSTKVFTVGYSVLCILFYAIVLIVIGKQMDKMSHLLKTYLLVLTVPGIYIVYYILTHSDGILAMMLASVIASIIVAFVMIFTNAWIPYFFRSEKRFNNISIFYNLGVSICGGSTPVVCAYLQNIGDTSWPYIYISIFSVLCTIMISYLSKIKLY